MRKSRRALSLLETVIGLFLLAWVLLLVTRLFHVASRYAKESAQSQRAAVILDKNMQRLRTWAEQKAAGSYNYAHLLSRDGETYQDPDDSAYQVTLGVSEATLFSPCTQLETRFPPASRRQSQAALEVEVTVSWGTGQNRSLAGSTLIGDPPRQSVVVEITPAVLSDLAKDGDTVLNATLKDEDGQAVPGAMFGWYLNPHGGNAELLPDRTGRTATLKNRIKNPDGSFSYTGGGVTVVAWTRYRGAEIRGETAVIGLLQ